MRRASQKGLTLVELVVSFSIMLILATMAVPLAKVKVRTQRELELKYALRDMRHAIDKYKEACDLGTFGAIKQGTFCYPESLDILVDGVKTQTADAKKMKFLRRIPRDPFTNSKEWGLRSMQDDIKSESGAAITFSTFIARRARRTPMANPMRNGRRKNQRGLTLIELVVAFTIMAVLSTLMLPLARIKIRIQREADLRWDLEQMRNAIDRYKDNCDQGYFGPRNWDRIATPIPSICWWKGKSWRTIPMAPR
jgi:general secretion pathway protein G